jgi:hypothetical protein
MFGTLFEKSPLPRVRLKLETVYGKAFWWKDFPNKGTKMRAFDPTFSEHVPHPFKPNLLCRTTETLGLWLSTLTNLPTFSPSSNFNACCKWVEVEHTFSWVHMGHIRTNPQSTLANLSFAAVHYQSHTIHHFIFSLCFHMVFNNSLLFMSVSNLILINLHFMDMKSHILIFFSYACWRIGKKSEIVIKWR